MSQPDPGQDDLQTRLRAGDPQALAELFDAHRQRLWRMANFRMDERLRGRVSPDDIVQETYLAAASRIRHYAEMATASPFVWVRMVMHQTLIDVRRRHLGAKMRDAARDVSLNRRRHTQTTVASLAIHLVGDFSFVLWDGPAFFDDTWAFNVGLSEVSYPIGGTPGYGLANLVNVFHLAPSRYHYFPFWIFHLFVTLPVGIVLVRWLRRKPTVASTAVSFALFLFVFLFFSRIFHHNYLGPIFFLLAAATFGERLGDEE